MPISPIFQVGNRIYDYSRRDIGRLRKRRRRPELGGHPHNFVLQSGAAQAWLGWSRKDALDTLASVARSAQNQRVPTHTLIFQNTDPRPARPRSHREPLWRRYLRAFTAHAARAHRPTAMKRAAAETITEYLLEEHGLGRRDDPADPPDYHTWRILTGLDEPWREIEPLLRLYQRLNRP